MRNSVGVGFWKKKRAVVIYFALVICLSNGHL